MNRPAPDATSAAARPLGFWSVTALVVGHTIGVGIFLTPAELIGAVGSPALTLALWATGGALVLAGAFTFGELASRFPFAGGPYVYLREAWGSRVAFLYGWQSLLVIDPGVTAALAAGLAQYVAVLWPAAAGAERWVAIAAIWLLAAISMAGVIAGARVLAVLTTFKLLACAGIVLLAFTVGDGQWAHFTPFAERHVRAVPLAEAIAVGFIAVFFSFGGFWEASRIAGEVREARRTMPAALALGVASVTTIYLTMTVAFVYLVPAREAATAEAFARRVGTAVLGPAGPAVFAAVVVLSVAASALALLIMAPRLYVAMSRDGVFPSALAHVDASGRAPVRATGVLAALATVFVWIGTFEQIVAFFMCTTLVFVALAAGALLVIRRRGEVPAGSFQAPGYPVTPVGFVLFVGAIVVLIAVNRPVQAAIGVAIIVAGLIAHRLWARIPGPV